MSPATFRRSLLVCCDLRRYGAADDQLQRELQELLVRCLDRAGAAAGLDRSTWHRQAKGDEEWAVLPPDSPEHVVVDAYVRRLNAELTSANRYRVPEARARMRLAIHHGAVVEGANGFPGQDSVLVSRLLNSKPAHLALEEFPEADLVVVLSEIVYSTLVQAGHTTLRPTDFRRVEVVEKTFHGHGWMWIPNGDVHQLDLDGSPGAHQAPAVNQHAVATGGSTVVQTGRDANIPIYQQSEFMQNFYRNDQRGSHFGPGFRKDGEADSTR